MTIGRFFWLIMGTGILTIVEVMLIGENQCCLSNILFMICGFIFALKYPEGFKNGIMKCLDYIGEKYSLGIYILHPIVGEMISSIAGRVGFGGMAIWKWCFPISVIIFSMFMWKLWSIVHNKCWRYISYDFMG